MGLHKKMERLREEAYAKGFHQACDSWEAALNRTRRIGPKTREKIMAAVRKLAEEVQRR
ncbi:hypothetical protein [Effusibacillus pohliae]|uniref:hypothetical protein n=1 Tax=Effusibacillus pohliae TaxID=232270 RepID=UPI000364AE29|nr:hypothetical protein [Effusibacillus pohliae]